MFPKGLILSHMLTVCVVTRCRGFSEVKTEKDTGTQQGNQRLAKTQQHNRLLNFERFRWGVNCINSRAAFISKSRFFNH